VVLSCCRGLSWSELCDMFEGPFSRDAGHMQNIYHPRSKATELLNVKTGLGTTMVQLSPRVGMVPGLIIGVWSNQII